MDPLPPSKKRSHHDSGLETELDNEAHPVKRGTSDSPHANTSPAQDESISRGSISSPSSTTLTGDQVGQELPPNSQASTTISHGPIINIHFGPQPMTATRITIKGDHVEVTTFRGVHEKDTLSDGAVSAAKSDDGNPNSDDNGSNAVSPTASKRSSRPSLASEKSSTSDESLSQNQDNDDSVSVEGFKQASCKSDKEKDSVLDPNSLPAPQEVSVVPAGSSSAEPPFTSSASESSSDANFNPSPGPVSTEPDTDAESNSAPDFYPSPGPLSTTCDSNSDVNPCSEGASSSLHATRGSTPNPSSPQATISASSTPSPSRPNLDSTPLNTPNVSLPSAGSSLPTLLASQDPHRNLSGNPTITFIPNLSNRSSITKSTPVPGWRFHALKRRVDALLPQMEAANAALAAARRDGDLKMLDMECLEKGAKAHIEMGLALKGCFKKHKEEK